MTFTQAAGGNNHAPTAGRNRANSSSRQALARQGEAFAAQLYAARGGIVLARNVSYAAGELDLVVREADGTYVFVEVKTRSSSQFGVADAVTPRKYARMRKAARLWLQGRCSLSEVRFDVVALTLNRASQRHRADPLHSLQGGSQFDVEYFAGIEEGASYGIG